MEQYLGNLFENDGWIPLYSITVGRCRYCYTKTTAYCSGCFYAYYCSRECQQKDYHNHKIVCSKDLKLKVLDFEFAHIKDNEYKIIMKTINDKFTKKFKCFDLIDPMHVIMPRDDYLAIRSIEREFWKTLTIPTEELIKMKNIKEALRYYGMRTIAQLKKTALEETMRLHGVYEWEMDEFIKKYKSGEIKYRILDFNIYRVKELIKVILKEHYAQSSGVVPQKDILATTSLFHVGHACLFFARVINKFYNEAPEIISCFKVLADGTYYAHIYVSLAGHVFDIYSEIEMELANRQEMRRLRDYRLEFSEPDGGKEIKPELRDLLSEFVSISEHLEDKSNSFIALAELWERLAGSDEDFLCELKDHHKGVDWKIFESCQYLIEKKEYPPEYAEKIV